MSHRRKDICETRTHLQGIYVSWYLRKARVKYGCLENMQRKVKLADSGVASWSRIIGNLDTEGGWRLEYKDS